MAKKTHKETYTLAFGKRLQQIPKCQSGKM